MAEKERKYNVVAIDGPAGSGKSTIAKKLAHKLGFIHADSGAIYRTLTLCLIQKYGAQETEAEFGNIFETESAIDFEFPECEVLLKDGIQSNWIQGRDVGAKIRTLAVTERIRYIADNVNCRKTVNRLLQSFAGQSNLVVDGRDIGTIVFPDAPIKFYLDASIQIRALRRFNEYPKDTRQEHTVQQFENDIRARDVQDRSRVYGALQLAGDAILIDTTELTINAVLSKIMGYIKRSSVVFVPASEKTFNTS